MQILNNHAIRPGFRLIEDKLQQDNEPKHTSKIVKNIWKRRCALSNVVSSQSSFKYYRACLGLSRLKKMERYSKNVNALQNVLQEEWKHFIKKLNESVKKRIKEVIKNKGGHTKY